TSGQARKQLSTNHAHQAIREAAEKGGVSESWRPLLSGPSARRTPGATDNTSPRSPRSGGLHPPCSGPCETRTSTCRSFARISSGLYRFLVIAVLLDVKTCLMSDHFNGGGSASRSHISRDVVTLRSPAVGADLASTLRQGLNLATNRSHFH